MKVRIQLDDDWRCSLAFECPSCGKWQPGSVQTAYTGEEFVCDCGEDIRLTSESMGCVRGELEEARALLTRVVEIPV